MCELSESLGLSIGATNLGAARPGRQPVTRRSVLTLWGNRPAEVGVPSQNPELTSPNLTEAGQVFRGFVERVGDPVPLVAADGSPHRSDDLIAEALEAMARDGRRRLATVHRGRRGAGVLGSGSGRIPARCAAHPAHPVAERCAADADLRCDGRAGRPADRPGAAFAGRGGVVRLRRQRRQHHAGRRRSQPPADRRDGAFRRVLRRPDRPGAADAGARRYPRCRQPRPGQHQRGRAP